MKKMKLAIAVFVEFLIILMLFEARANLAADSELRFQTETESDGPFLLAQGLNIVNVRHDSGYIYFSEYGANGAVKRVSALGGTVETLMSPENTPTDKAFDSQYIYYIAQDAGQIVRIRKTDLTVETFRSGLNHPSRITVHGDSVYFTERDGDRLWRIFRDNNTDHPGYPITVDKPSGLALDSEFVYITEWSAGNIEKVPLDGGIPETIASGLQPYLDNVALDSDYVYYSESPVSGTHGTILGDVGRVPKSGGSVQVLVTDQQHPYELAVDSRFVYFTEVATGNIKRVLKSGGSVETLVSDLNGPRTLCIEPDYLYFAEQGSPGGIYSLSLPHDVAVSDVVPLKSVVGQGFNLSVDVTVQNQGEFAETFNVTLCANATAVASATDIALPIAGSTTVTLVWNTSAFSKGHYSMSAFADSVLGETVLTNNNMTDGTIYVGVPGDVNGDRIVNMLDLYLIALNFGKTAPYATPEIASCDVDCNGITNMIDLYIAATHYGERES